MREKLKKVEMIEFHVVEHCNLNCKCCMHFSPLAPKSFINPKEFKQDVKKMAELVGSEIKNIHILGGEPLLHPELQKLLRITRHYFPNVDVQLISNGILLTKQKSDFWNTLKKYNIHLSVTRYPLDINYQQISYLTKKYGIKYTFYAPNKENSQWHFPLDLKGTQNPQNSFENCEKGNNCTNINVYKGKLYMCPIIAYARYFNEYFGKNLEVTSLDYLSLKEINGIEEIREFVSVPSPFCRYCDIENRTFENKWEVSKKNIEEWI